MPLATKVVALSVVRTLIFSNLRAHDAAKACRVCSTWQRAIDSDDVLWKEISDQEKLSPSLLLVKEAIHESCHDWPTWKQLRAQWV